MPRTDRSTPPVVARLALVAVAGAAMALWLSTRAWRHAVAATDLAAAGDPAAVGPVVTTVVLTAGAVTATWYLLTALLGAVAVLGRRTERTLRLVRRWGAPVLRHAVAGAAAAGTGLSLIAAAPVPTASDVAPVSATAVDDLPADLGWGTAWPAPGPDPGSPAEPSGSRETPPLDAPTTPPDAPPTTPPPVAPSTPSIAPPPAMRPASAPPGGPSSVAAYPVVAGDSLWSIAAAHLGPGATAAEVAASWPRWYAANRDVVGPDPHLIRPGQLLSPPSEEALR